MKKQNVQPKDRKIFLNNMNSWLSNFIIENLRTEAVTDPKITKNEFMGTINTSKLKLPHLFEPKIVKIDYNFHFEHEVFSNDVFVYDLQDSDYNEIEYLIKGLKTLKHNTEKTLIIISSIMTWARTQPKLYKEKTDDEDDNKNNERHESDDEDLILEELEEKKEMEGIEDNLKESIPVYILY